MTTFKARKPDLESDAWADSLDIVSNMSTVKILLETAYGLWQTLRTKRDTSRSGSNETFTFSGSTAKKVVEKNNR